ncbi:MAG: hypothetical protein QF357_10655 [Dehalococcoidia bacterium]|jgi:hypothetical protein|nr:hypothetical protein [Dehalococcoidia bacterium]
MPAFKHFSRPRFRWKALVAALPIVVLFSIGCGSGGDGDGGSEIGKITASEVIYTIDDFTDFGFKTQKDYDVTDLPGGVAAWVGFWGPDASNRKDYELRFYASHGDAVEYGPALAEEVTGENALSFRKNPTWEEGAKDRWQNAFTGDLQASSVSGPSPKYGDYIIFGNVLMLCEGADSGQGLERCRALVGELTAEVE